HCSRGYRRRGLRYGLTASVVIVTYPGACGVSTFSVGGAVIKILLVEDDPDILDLTSYVLRRERFVVTEATDGAQALRRWKADRPDLVIMDLGLPGLDGFEVLRRIREEDQTPILVITGRKDAHDILRAFNLGTDDFVPKPFEFRELIARVRAILRRTQAAHAETVEPSVQLDGLTLDPVPYEVTWRNESVRLTPTEFRILYLLVTNAGHVVPRSEEHTSELQSRFDLVCRLLLEKKKTLKVLLLVIEHHSR